MLQSIEVAKGHFVMASAISSYEYDEDNDVTLITLKGRKKDPIKVKKNYVQKINSFLARGSVTLSLDGTMQDRR